MTEIRCANCNRLLAKVEGLALIEIVCPRCKAVNEWPILDTLEVQHGSNGNRSRREVEASSS